MELKALAFRPYTTKEIKPAGWFKRQLEIQADGLSGNLDKFWPDIKDSKWIGGDRDGWERVPYWLDGFIPLAYLLGDEDMISRARFYISSIMNNQEKDGWICPCPEDERDRYDIWAYFLILKVLVVYYESSDDAVVENVVYNALKKLDQHIDTCTLFNWAQTRWFEVLIPIYWMYERKPEPWLLELVIKLRAQGFDYPALYENFPYTGKEQIGKWSQMNHVVNHAMAVKSMALFHRVSGRAEDLSFADTMLDILKRYHGTVTGIFTGDECLSGKSPIQGTELCAVVEFMYSLEHLLQITGDPKWADYLEYIAYNVLPATVSPDMWTHQYDQLVNQIQCSRIPGGEVHFSNNGGDSHMFGLEPNFGCCTANMHQGFPKFMLSAYMKSMDGIAAMLYIPSTLHTQIDDKAVEISLDTEYPFQNRLTYTIHAEEPIAFRFLIRIHEKAKGLTVNGIPVSDVGFYAMDKVWHGTEKVIVDFEFDTEVIDRENDLHAIRRGPLLYTIGINEEWRKVDYGEAEELRVYPHCDYELFPLSDYSYAIRSTELTYQFHGVGQYPFGRENPPVTAKTEGYKIDWKETNGVIHEKPESVEPVSEPEEITLIPYGCSNLRVTEFPIYPST